MTFKTINNKSTPQTAQSCNRTFFFQEYLIRTTFTMRQIEYDEKNNCGVAKMKTLKYVQQNSISHCIIILSI